MSDPWAGVTTATVLWGTQPLTPDRFDRVLREMAADPGLPPPFRALTATYHVSSEVTYQAFQDSVTRLLDALSVRETEIVVVLARRGVAVLNSHRLGDASVSAALVTDLISGEASTSLQGRLPPAGLPVLAGTLLTWWVSDLRRVADAVTSFRRRFRRKAEERRTNPARPDATGTVVLAERLPPDELAELQRWRRAHAPDLSISMLVLGELYGALVECGVLPAEVSCRVMVNLRRYSPRLSDRTGNLVSGVDYRVSERVSATQAAEQVRRAVASGDPLFVQLVNGLRTRTRTGRPREPAPEQVSEVPFMTWSDRGSMRGWDPARVPWDDPAAAAEHVVVSGVVPAIPNRIALSVNRHEGMNIACSFRATSFDAGEVSSALALGLGRVRARLVGGEPVGR